MHMLLGANTADAVLQALDRQRGVYQLLSGSCITSPQFGAVHCQMEYLTSLLPEREREGEKVNV